MIAPTTGRGLISVCSMLTIKSQKPIRKSYRARREAANMASECDVIQTLNRPSTSDQDRKRGVGVILSFILISWERGSPLLNADPRKIPFKQRASHAVRFSLSHFAWILATQLSTGLLPARNRFPAIVRSVCAIRLSGTVGDANRLMMKITTGSKFAAAPVDSAT